MSSGGELRKCRRFAEDGGPVMICAAVVSPFPSPQTLTRGFEVWGEG